MKNMPSEGRKGTLDASGDESGVVMGGHGEKVLRRAVPLFAEGKVSPLPESAVRIARECDRIKAFLIEKNLSYGNSALEPVRIFSDASPVEQLLVRIDDKLSRKKRGRPFQGDNDRVDLIGYLILLGLAEEDG